MLLVETQVKQLQLIKKQTGRLRNRNEWSKRVSWLEPDQG